MPLQKQAFQINFANGLDTKTDPIQVEAGKLLDLENSVFDVGNLLKKRNGFADLLTLPDDTYTYLTTFKDSLVAIGENLALYVPELATPMVEGALQLCQLSSIALIRRGIDLTVVDGVVASNGLAIVVYKDASSNCWYQVCDATTGESIGDAETVSGSNVRAFILNTNFIVTYTSTSNIYYIAVPINNPTNPTTPALLSTVLSSGTPTYDGIVANSNLYIAYNASDGGGAIRVTYLDATLLQHGVYVEAGVTADLISCCADTSGSSPVIWVTYWDTTSNDAHSMAFSQIIAQILAPTETVTNQELTTLTSVATDNTCTIFYEVDHDYSYSAIQSDYIEKNTCTIGGVVGTAAVVQQSVGLASKATLYGSKIYMLAVYAQTYQPTYFLIDSDGDIVAKLAYSNASGYFTQQVLPAISVNDNVLSVPYLYRAQIVGTNKDQGATVVNPVVTIRGINLASFEIQKDVIVSSEIGNNLHITGGFLWMFDGVKPVEQGFHVYPEDLVATTATTTGSMTAQIYYYCVTYEWTDAQGNVHRSAPSVPLKVDLSGSGTSTNKVTLNIPYLRLTYKSSPNQARIVIYRWSTAQPIYYQVTSATAPTLNNNEPAVGSESVAYVDTVADSSILGNLILYTTGGVVENISAPATSVSTLFKSRLLVVDAEDPNLIWYSKQVIESTPVEMSDLFTIYVAPTISSTGPTGSIKCLSAMDDKAIIFKKDAIYYFTGNGPDNTGANNDFSEPTFITSSVGCTNQNSIVLMPQGLMFQSAGKGIWLLGRDLSTNYIGAPVERYNDLTIKSAVAVPETNQIRFTLEDGTILMYDYYYNQWGTFTNLSALSSTIYNGLHTYLLDTGVVRIENPDSYLDASNPVNMRFRSAWIKVGGIQGYQRLYQLQLIGKYYTPHKLQVQVCYDYNPNPAQTVIITPYNYSGGYGDEPYYGDGSPYGGPGQLEQWQVYFERQRCQAVQIIINEVFDASYETTPGQGFTLSALSFVIGLKKTYVPLPAVQSAG